MIIATAKFGGRGRKARVTDVTRRRGGRRGKEEEAAASRSQANRGRSRPQDLKRPRKYTTERRVGPCRTLAATAPILSSFLSRNGNEVSRLEHRRGIQAFDWLD